jgi:hypothetical protein
MANPVQDKLDTFDTLDDWPMYEDLILAVQAASEAWPVARWCGNGLGGFDPDAKDQPCPGCQHCITVKICPNGLGGYVQGKDGQECNGCLHCLPSEMLSAGLHTLPPLPRLILELGPRNTVILTGIEPCDTIAVAEQLLHIHKFSWLQRKGHWIKQISPEATTEGALALLHSLRSIAHVDLGRVLADAIGTQKVTFMDVHTDPSSSRIRQDLVPPPPSPSRTLKRPAESDINL